MRGGVFSVTLLFVRRSLADFLSPGHREPELSSALIFYSFFVDTSTYSISHPSVTVSQIAQLPVYGLSRASLREVHMIPYYGRMTATQGHFFIPTLFDWFMIAY